MTTWEFPCSEPATISVNPWASGSVAISGEQTDTIKVEIVGSRGSNIDDLLAEIRVVYEDGNLTIAGPKQNSGWRRGKSLDLTIIAPAESNCEVNAASADVGCVGSLHDLSLRTASGDITVKSASGRAELRTASGDVFLDQGGADVIVNTASGDVRIGQAEGQVDVKTASGDVTVSTGGNVTAHTASGDIDIKDLSANADLGTLAGDVRVAVVPGRGVYLDLATTAGDVRNDLDEADGDDTSTGAEAPIEIRCRSLSGDIRIGKSPRAASRSATQ